MKVAFVFAIVLAVLVCNVSAGVLFERTAAPQGWTRVARSSSNAGVQFTIALKQRNLAALEDVFWAVSDPDGERYQKYLTQAEIDDIVAPSPAVFQKVKQWLLQHGVAASGIVQFGDALDVSTTVDRAESLFHTEFWTWRHTGGKTRVAAFGQYSLPDSIHKHVDMVTGLSTFPIPHLKTRFTPSNPAQAQEVVVPQFTSLIYSIPALTTGSNPGITQGVIEYEDQYFSNNDTELLSQLVGVKIQQIPASNVVGSNDPTQPGVEAALDVQWQNAVNPTATPWFWIEGGTGWLYTFALHFLNTTTVPDITSTSYGWWEGDQCEDGIGGQECQSLGVNSTGYVVRVNTEFQKFGVRGVTLLISSGDSGANGRTNGQCTVPQLRPAFPASSPYVTSVGATEIRNPVYNLTNAPSVCTGQGFSCVGGGLEAAVSIDNSGYASGGGFSNISSRPSYQDAAVTAYLNSGVQLPPASYYNAAGRAHPDVSALGQNALTVIGGQAEPVSGTSMSSPIFSGVVALLNAEYVKLTGASFGFLNPLLYKIAAEFPNAFQDITLGDNICTEDGCSPGCEGFYATKGWDPVTGLGTPNYTNLLAAIQAIAARVVARR